MGTQNFLVPNNELTLIGRAQRLLFTSGTITQKFNLLFNKEKFNAYRQPKIEELEREREPNDEKFRKIFKKLDKDAKIILFCCKAGKGHSNIAEHIANLAEGKEVITSTTFTHGMGFDIKITESSNYQETIQFKCLNLAVIALITHLFYKIITPNRFQDYLWDFWGLIFLNVLKLTPWVGWDVTKVTTGQPEPAKISTYFDRFKNYFNTASFPLPLG